MKNNLKSVFFIALLLASIIGFSQNLQNNNWIINNGVPGVNFGTTNTSTFPFPSIPAAPPTDNTPLYLEGSATLSDQSGNLLLFSDGKRLWKNNPDATATLITTGLLGDSSSTQNVIFIPKPGNPNRYYVVTINGATSLKKGLYYSEVDVVSASMILPLNRVLSTGTYFDTNFNQIQSATINPDFKNESESITSAKHSNGRDYWLIVHVQNQTRGAMLSFKVSCNGILSNKAEVAMELSIQNQGGGIAHSLKVSPNGNRIALSTTNGFFFGTFNNTSGAINLNNFLDYNNSNFNQGYGVEFSPNSNILFYSNGNGVIARDLTSGNQTVINDNNSQIGLQLARNGRIYLTNNQVINNPNNINDLQLAVSSIVSQLGFPQWVHQQTGSNSTIIAQNDALNINSCTQSSVSVLQNNSNGADMLNGNPLTNLSGNATLSIVGSITPIPSQGSIVLNPTNGVITVAAGTSTGTYTLRYKLCTLGICPTCSNEAVVTINVSSSQSVVPTFNLPSSICNGSVATILPTTSTNPTGITGTWSPSVVSNTTTGNYTFTPNAGQCASTVVITITVVQKVTPTFNLPSSICNGSVAPILPTTSTNPIGITGTWSPSSVSNTTSGNYTFTPNTGQCANVLVVHITVNDIVTPTFNITTLICNGCTAPILPTTSSNPIGITGTWSPSVVSNTTSGVYVFTPNTGQCSTSTSINISIATSLPTANCFGFDPPQGTPDINEEGQLNYGYIGYPYNLPVSSTGLTFTWYFKFKQGQLFTFNVQNPTFRELCPSNPIKSFACVVSNGLQTKTYKSIDPSYPIPGISGIKSTPTCFIHPECSPEETERSQNATFKELIVYPNPTNSTINFKGENLDKCKVSIYNNLGIEVIKNSKANETIHLENLQNGIYLYKITDENGFEQNGKIIKE
jgi:hypothetical protein